MARTKTTGPKTATTSTTGSTTSTRKPRASRAKIKVTYNIFDLAYLLCVHDWTYENSDDNQYIKAGKENWKRIEEAAEQNKPSGVLLVKLAERYPKVNDILDALENICRTPVNEWSLTYGLDTDKERWTMLIKAWQLSKQKKEEEMENITQPLPDNDPGKELSKEAQEARQKAERRDLLLNQLCAFLDLDRKMIQNIEQAIYFVNRKDRRGKRIAGVAFERTWYLANKDRALVFFRYVRGKANQKGREVIQGAEGVQWYVPSK